MYPDSYVNELKEKLINLEYENKLLKEENKLLNKSSDDKVFKYLTEKKEFSKELMKDDVINKYKREISNLNKHINQLNNKIKDYESRN